MTKLGIQTIQYILFPSVLAYILVGLSTKVELNIDTYHDEQGTSYQISIDGKENR